jgi:hypothetical protein
MSNKHFFSSIPTCNNCPSLKSFYQNAGKVDAKLIKPKKATTRKIYFAPVGNHFNFGFFNKNETPKIVIMGMTTSPTARDNFYNSVQEYLNKNFILEDAIKESCIINIFNSQNPKLLNILTGIFNLCNIWKLIGIDNKYNLSSIFNDYKNPKYREIMNNIYFTQYILCCSCYTRDDRKAPKKRDIDNAHLECIEFQKQLFNSFHKKVDLIISFGKVHKFPGFDILKAKYSKHIPISHPAGAYGWNKISLFNLSKSRFDNELQKIEKQGYRTQVDNCYNQVQLIKKYISTLRSK